MPHETLYTIGHSNRSLEDFLALLQGESIARLVDVRRFPGSRRHPHFGQEALAESLHEAGIVYRHLPELGGRRSKRLENSPNTAWEVEAFNAYADHLQSEEFATGLAALVEEARAGRTVIMCSEAMPWQCHRRLIADALLARGWTVLDILGPRSTRPHKLTSFASVDGTQVTYPGRTLFDEGEREG
jgi:uncharacterized protein (DUF488 family)